VHTGGEKGSYYDALARFFGPMGRVGRVMQVIAAWLQSADGSPSWCNSLFKISR